ncbi:polysaccharide biosynthesis tyrosine autokinase [bacterium]|nr:polysaccharide biosynthesis tyrosine autokinase [bacterium]
METEYQEQQVTLNDYLAVLYRGRLIIALSFFLVMAVTVYVTFTTQPVYEASAWVMYEEQGGVQQMFEMSSFIKKETMINNQVIILKSRRLAENVIRELQASPHADSLWILGNRKEDARFSLREWLMSVIRPEREETETDFADIVDHFRKNVITVAPQRDTDVIELKVQAFSPFEAAYIANTWMKLYRKLDIEESTSEVKEVGTFLEDKLAEVEESLKASEQALKDFKESENVTELTGETQALIEKAAEFESLYQSARTDYEANLKRIATLEGQLDNNQKKILKSATSASSEFIKQLELQRATLAGEIAAMEQQLKSSNLDAGYQKGLLEERKERLKGLQEKIVTEKQDMIQSGVAFDPLAVNSDLMGTILSLNAENDYLKEKADALWGIVIQYRDELNKLPSKSLRLAVLQREATVNNTIYSMIRQKYEENRIVEAGEIGQVRIIDLARPPAMDEPIKPKKKMNLLLGFMLGLGLGVGITFGREYMDSSLKTIEDVERMGMAVLGSIPLIAPHAMERTVKENGNGEIKRLQSRLITHFAPKSPISEAYRTLRTNILYSKADSRVQTVLVSSSGPGEGKSTSICNLAIAFAQMGTKTLIIDADLRRPVQHGIFEVERNIGLTNVLVGNTSLEEAIKSTPVTNLDLITSGTLPPNPSELLASQAMDDFIKKVKKQYNMVLFDSPPIIAVTDACVMARKMDGVIVVIKSGETNADALSRAMVLLNNVNAGVLGITVNGVDVDRMYGSYYYYYHYYYYGDGKGKKKMRKIVNPFRKVHMD